MLTSFQEGACLLFNMFLWMAFGLPCLSASPGHPAFLSHEIKPPSSSWLEKRWYGVVRQKHKFSCGTAALATLLRYAYGKPVPEEDILAQVDTNKPISFATLADCAARYGIIGEGYRMTWPQLCSASKKPCIVALQDTAEGHFSVCYLIDSQGKYLMLGDPSWGMRVVPVHSFLKSWQKPGTSWGYALFFRSNLKRENPDLSDFLPRNRNESLDQNLFPGIMHLLR
ncbi:C39 family peptidase [Candidatus Similichlamydia laticola]|uniref:C39 family peptidase n=1 Tax=Candidatus Similichlamydia laticola TaxID=2170265 RepID=UPI000DF85A99|nr:cysteine peptidase family C39 domain-containing protein [Candidatus Similichlamydia laticola]